MKKSILFGLIILCAMLVAVSTSNAYEILIDVSPNVLNLQSSGTVVTVHTNVDYNTVIASSVFLNGVPIYFYKSDDRGYFVAKFVMDDVKDLPLIIGELNTLLLVGVTDDGLAFTGTQDIKVISIIPRGQK
ncbi:MAG: hypothetical protein HF978_03605 [Desulfobacteraceae bacterium]|nr:hypothetical protein [Desulfobacteraceae bacterium]MBC2754612.1 hypothetical protein [Desulfobacteraceae bacterium]